MDLEFFVLAALVVPVQQQELLTFLLDKLNAFAAIECRTVAARVRALGHGQRLQGSLAVVVGNAGLQAKGDRRHGGFVDPVHRYLL
jgi:hypothetical protein